MKKSESQTTRIDIFLPFAIIHYGYSIISLQQQHNPLSPLPEYLRGLIRFLVYGSEIL